MVWSSGVVQQPSSVRLSREAAISQAQLQFNAVPVCYPLWHSMHRPHSLHHDTHAWQSSSASKVTLPLPDVLVSGWLT
ncbi:hypothetical protein E2C01_086510 [Portunus trituberculatus]|uniref:Uncharacterized protein n=1 Tax=Portunus trituberculatus TaxID=210409 RepID=A0A5B7J411_PORTR|nr:hypothetical protein [Portunus trituberculatus]